MRNSAADSVTSIEGIFSGTLAWLFNKYDGSAPFSQLVAEARALGYTEPDPRDDLSGTDVARKLVILARESGMPLSLADVQVESLVPDALRGADRDAFMAGLETLDAPMQARLDTARANGCVLMFDAKTQLPYSAPKVRTADELIAENSAVRDGLLRTATLAIAPLQDAVDLGDATLAEESALKAWKEYRVAVNRAALDTATPVWPLPPDA